MRTQPKRTARGRWVAVLVTSIVVLLNASALAVAAAPQLVTSIPVGDVPSAVAVNPLTNRIYVTNRQSNDVAVVDGATNTLLARIVSDQLPWGVAANPVTNRIYVAERGQSVAVIDGQTNAIITRVPVGFSAGDVAVNPVTNRVYVASFNDRYLAILDGSSNTLVATLSTGPGVAGIAVDPTTDRVYLTNRLLAGLQVINGATQTFGTFIATGDVPSRVAVNSKTHRLYVTGIPSVGVIDTTTNGVIARIDVGSADAVAVNELLDRVYVTSLGTNKLWAIDGSTSRAMSSVDLGSFPAGIAVDQVARRIYVTKFFDRALAVYSDTDVAPPSIEVSLSSTPNSADWYREDVTVTWTLSDASGIAASTGCETRTIASDTPGIVITCSATSVAGGTASRSVAIKLDKTPPSLTMDATKLDGSPYAAGEYTNQRVFVHAHCSDALSGLVWFCGDVVYPIEVINGVAQASAIDAAGNIATASFGPIRIDQTRPSVLGRGTLPDGSTYIPGLWTNQTVTVQFQCTDYWSGIASCSAPQDVSASGTASVRGTATDLAGNVGFNGRDFGPILIDKIAPTITATATLANGEAYVPGTWTNQDVAVRYACADDLSGLLSCTPEQTFSGEGVLGNATGSAIDRARNIASASFGPISIDRTAPTITFGGNAGNYLVSDWVAITCDAQDLLSGIATTTCPAVLNAPAFSFISGSASSMVTISASATDNASNAATVETTFAVTVTADGVCALAQTTMADQRAICAHVRSIAGAPNATARQHALDAFHNYLMAHVGRDLSAELAALFETLVPLL